MKKRLFNMYICFIVFNALICGVARAETLPWRNREECVKNFDVKKINLSEELSKEQAKGYDELLKNYFICKAISTNDIKECDYLMYESSHQQCYKTYRQYKLWVDLIRKGSVPSDVRSGFSDVNEDFIRAFSNGDEKFCDSLDNSDNCKATISLNEGKATDWQTRSYIIFAKAIKNSDVNLCNKLSARDNVGRGIDMSQTCKAVVNRNPAPCQKCEGVDTVIQAYCDNLFSVKAEGSDANQATTKEGWDVR